MIDASWMDRAACRGLPLEGFFPNGNSVATMAQIDQAKAVCRDCPVRRQCAQYAADLSIEYGIFGGRDEFERTGRARRAKRVPRKRSYSDDTLENVQRLTAQRYSETEIALMLRITARTVARYKKRARELKVLRDFPRERRRV